MGIYGHSVRKLLTVSANQLCVRNFTRLKGLEDVLILSGVRTPIGSYRGTLTPLTAPKLGAAAIKAAVERAGIEAKAVQEVCMGNGVQAGVGQDPCRQATLAAGLDKGTPTCTVSKVCASGMKTIMIASQSLMSGSQEIMVAGGMESMSNGVFYLRRGETPYGGITMPDGVVLDGLTDAYDNIHMGMCAEKSAAKYNITREASDQYATESYKRVSAGYAAKVFDKELIPITVPAAKKGAPAIVMKEDEEYKRVNFQKIPTLKPAFIKDGTITAANASKLNDGAAAVVLTTGSALKRLPKACKPLARIVGFCDAATDPVHFSVAPALAVPKLLEQTGVKKDDVALWEFNEAFSSVALICMKVADIDPVKVNVHGGAVALGHPIGASGARIIVHLIHALKPGQIGVAAICNGGGGASAMMIERL